MKVIMAKYIKVLKIELEDLINDINMLITGYENLGHDKKITNYVLLENLAVLKNEIGGINSFNTVMDNMNLDNYKSIDDFIGDVEMRFKHRVEESGLAPAVFKMIDRKLNKVRKYVKDD